jgi:hypothetical protein
MKRKPATITGATLSAKLSPLADRVFFLGFYTLSAKLADRSELALHQRIALWQSDEQRWRAWGQQRLSTPLSSSLTMTAAQRESR